MALRHHLRVFSLAFVPARFRWLLVPLVLLLVGCGSGADAGASPAASGSSSPTVDSRPTPASSKGPARNLPKPQLPEAAKQNTKEGFAAFTQYWFDSVTYALETNDPDAIRAISKPDCKVCNVYVAEAQTAKGSGAWAEGPRWRVSKFASDMSRDYLKQALGLFMLDESPSTNYDSTGKTVKSRKGGNDGNPKEIYAVYEEGRWVTAQAGQS